MLFKRLYEHMLLEHVPACEMPTPPTSAASGLESLLKITISFLPAVNELVL